MAHIQASSIIEASPSEVFQMHEEPLQLKGLLSGILEIEFASKPKQKLYKGEILDLVVGRHGISRKCKLKVEDIVFDRKMELKQAQGLFKSYKHIVKFEEHGSGTLITDFVEYRLPLGILGHLLDDLFMHEDIRRGIERRYENLKKKFVKI